MVGQRTFQIFVLVCAGPILLQIALSLLVPSSGHIVDPPLLFAVVVVAASLCAMFAGVLIVRSWRTVTPELAYVGLFFLSVSALPLVHGITTPGVLYGDNTATMASIFWAIPVGLVVASPVVTPRWLATKLWRKWTVASVLAITALSITMLLSPELVPMPTPRSFGANLIVGISAAGCIALAYRHFRLALIARRSAPLIVSAGYGLVASSAFVWIGAEPYSAAFWSAHALDIGGVFAGLIASLVVYRHRGSMSDVLAPVLAVDPISAFEAGLEPLVLDFVADLDLKDPLTRDHVVRTAELSITVACELKMAPADQRRIGLAALLHDVGKLQIPDEILKKPGDLTAAEYSIIKSHASLGADVLKSTTTIQDLASVVRAHHERTDGQGYPDALRGAEIPIEARVIAACDAFDAMSQTRHYRAGMHIEEVIGVMRHHAGSQWDTSVVDALVRVVRRDPPQAPRILTDTRTPLGCDCLPNLAATSVGITGDTSATQQPSAQELARSQ